jgi:succinate dehydrogenase / fumarate reductase cytochrome b subunit
VKPVPRPVYLDLFRIHLPLPGWVSFLHRVSGALLFLALPAGVWLLSVSLSGEEGYRRISDGVAHPLARVSTLLLVWALSHHFLAGVRHLALDIHWGEDLVSARRSGLAVMLGAGIATLAVGWRLFG